MNNILYISSLCSDRLFEIIFKTSNDNSGQSIQKFHKLLVTGLSSQSKNKVELLVSLPITNRINKKKIWFLKKEKDFNSNITYIPTINLPFLKNILDFFYTFFKVIFWRNKKLKNKFIIVDVLKLSPVFGAFLACKIRNIKIISIITDMPGIDVFQNTLKKKLKTLLINSFLTNCDGYILITEYMNEIVNPRKRPNIVMEGLVDFAMKSTKSNKKIQKNIVYTGGLYERYGLKKLIEAFLKIDDKNLRLHFYGEGPMKNYIQNYTKIDVRIDYKGVVLNNILVKRQIEAFLLINPRPTDEELTKFSFPGKNMEYMVSGTPTLTTKLLGMPDDYLPFVFLIEDETIDGVRKSIENVLLKSDNELKEMGRNSKKFVLENKNNLIQAERITNFLNQL
jgi:glycosyltransferase involved in cell wall biosynthesis